MTLSRRLSTLFLAHRVHTFTFALDAVALVRREHRRWLWRLVCGVGLGVVLGFTACFLWLSARLEVMASTMTAWHQVAETEWRQHHQPVKVGKAMAQVIVSQKAKEREP